MRKITLLFLMMFSAVFTFAQVSINENFYFTPLDWTGTFTYRDVQACSGRSYADYYSFSTLTGNLTSPNQVGASNGTDLSLSFDYKVISGFAGAATPAGWGTAVLEYSTDNGSNWITAFTIDNSNHVVANTCATISTTVPGANLAMGSDVKLRVSVTRAIGSFYFVIDNFIAQQVTTTPPNCGSGLASPTNGATDVPISGLLVWSNASGGITGYNVTVGTTSGASDIYSETLGNENSVSVGTLASGTLYFVNIVPFNTNGSAQGCTEYSFTTITCATAPYTQDFEGGVLPACWDLGGDEYWRFTNTAEGTNVGNFGTITGTSASGGYFAWVDDSSPDAANAELNSALVDVSGLTSLTLSFYQIRDNEGFQNATLTVSVYDGAAWNTVGTYNTNTAGWTQEIIDLSALTFTGDARARFSVADSGNHYDDVAIDDVTFDGIPLCPVPNALTATMITDTTADLAWTENGTAALWDIELVDVTAMGVATGTATATGVANPYAATGLIVNNDYAFYVRADCGVGGLTSGWNGPFAFTTLDTCNTPSGLNASTITGTTADLDWTENGTATVWNIELVDITASGIPTGTATSSGVSNPFNLTGLTPTYDYEFYVQSDCAANGTSAWIGPFAFTANCVSIAPYSEDFETFTTGNSAFVSGNCWAGTGGAYYWKSAPGTDTGSDNTGPSPTITTGNYFYTEASGGASGDVTDLVSPLVDLTALNAPAIIFNYHMLGNQIGTLEILVNGTTNVWTLSGEQQASEITAWGLAEIDLSAYAGQTISVTFRATSAGSFRGDISIDNVSFTELPACPLPTALTATIVTETTADLGWTENGAATVWNIELVDVTGMGAATGVPTATGVANPYSATSLVGDNTYQYYVQADCGVDGTSAWVGPFAFAPYYVAVAPDCASGTFIDSGGPGGDYTNNENITYTIMPDVMGNAVTVNFTAFSTENSASGCFDGLTIYNGPDATAPTFDPPAGGSIWCWDRNYNPAQGTGDLQGKMITSTHPSGALTFVFTSDGGAQRDGWEASVTCSTLGLCPIPSGLFTSTITDTTTNLGWIEDGAATVWNIELVNITAGGTATGTATATGVMSPYAATGLVADNNYEFYIQADCGVEDGTSAWAGPLAFATPYVAVPPTCSNGLFLDSGGVSGDYSASENITYTITPDIMGGIVTVDFTAFSTENVGSSCYDGLTIHDGPDATATTINPPAGGTIWCWDRDDFPADGSGDLQGMMITSTHPSGALTFVFTSDGSEQRDGWEASVTCSPPAPANDDCADATAIMLGAEFSGDTTNATDSGITNAACSMSGGNQDVWYSFVAPLSTTVSLSTTADFVAIYDGCGGNEVACLTNGGQSPTLMSGNTYYVRVYNSGFAKVAGLFTATLSEASLSTQDFNNELGFSYYPNPVKNTLTLNAQQAITNVIVFNMLGQEVIKTTPNAVSNDVDMSNLQSGPYFVQVTIGATVETVRVIKN
ncbi:T9SS type A sorting domain-containing protein [Lacinutrix jangbogonensis]|uniref:T9SS type A sorting domain-containing protein n=1 Tax=Lacinutrix jangbogonensis TaxID=1469557 RepID=UPI00053EC1C3|nr:T9SS type A sorting domain-containing protein [Lacinutrix jangbogonensis]